MKRKHTKYELEGKSALGPNEQGLSTGKAISQGFLTRVISSWGFQNVTGEINDGKIAIWWEIHHNRTQQLCKRQKISAIC